MTNVVAIARDPGDIMESVIVKGDLAKLTAAERAQYYGEVCRSVGLNPLTQPFAYITLNGKLTLYALRGATDQLRSIYKVSVEELSETERDGVFIVTCKVRNGEGRTDMAKGAVTVGSLKGDALANALMKAETKAKRRATLSICGLGMLDETEIETIPAAARRPAPVTSAPSVEGPQVPLPPEEMPPHDPTTGELDSMSESDFVTTDEVGKLNDMIESVGANRVKLLKLLKIGSLAELPADQYEHVVAELKAFGERKAARDE